jgi:cytoskeleton protein RodZ
VGSFGERLRREREMRGITLEEIAEATKIGSRSLRALEEEDFDKLPGGIFNKGFVRAYCRYLGIDAEQSVADYVAAVTEAQAAGKLARAEYTSPPAESEEVSEPIIGRIPWGMIIAALVLVAAGLAGRQYYAGHGWPKLFSREKPAAAAPQPQAATPAAQPAAEPVNPPVTSAPPAPTAPELANQPAPGRAESAIVLRIHARETAWVSITADGKHVTSEELPPNSDKTIRAEREVVLVTGNAGGVEVSLNNTPMPALGESGKKATVTYGPRGVVQQ